jgi:hypothetical protein
MKKTFLTFTLVSLAGLMLVGCQTAPVAVAPAKPKPVAAVEEETLYKNISVSQAKGVSSPFKTDRGTVFPENKMGYKLILSSDVSMPDLLATQLPSSDIQVLMRIYNRGEDQTLNIICARGEDRSTYQAHGVFFPANRARDIKFTVTQADSQNLSLIVAPSRE